MTDSPGNQGSGTKLDDLVAAMEAAGIYLAATVRDGAIVLEGEVDSEEMHQAALDIAGAVAERAGLEVEDAIEVLEIDVELGATAAADVDFADLSTADAESIAKVGTVDAGLAAEEAITYFPPTDPVIGEQFGDQDEVEVIGGFQPTSDDGDIEDVDADHPADDGRISEDVRRELKEDAMTTELTNIDVDTVNGVVFLRGDVPTLDDAENAEAVAERVAGVREVREELTILTMQSDRNG